MGSEMCIRDRTPAAERLSERIAGIELTMPVIPVLHNYNVQTSNSVDDIAANLVAQLDAPVRWVESVEKIQAMGVTHIIESGPGKVLSGLVKRIAKGVDVHSIEKAESISETALLAL